MQAIVKIDAAEYGLEETKAQQIAEMFKPMLDKMVELEDEYNQVVQLETSETTCQQAKALRLKYVKVRTGVAKIHKELKQFYLQGGRFVDGWKNAQLMASQGIEEKLTGIEKHYENLQKEYIVELQEERFAAMLKYTEEELIPATLGEMDIGIWENFLAGTKANYEARVKAEREAEEAQIVKEKAEAEEQARIRQENEKLKAERDKAERREKIEVKKRAKAEAERKAKELAEQKERAAVEAERKAKEAAERKVREDKERKEREAHEASLKAERQLREEAERKEREAQATIEAHATIEAERKAKKALAEQKERADAESVQQAELSKGDADKIVDLVADLRDVATKYAFKSKKNQSMYANLKIVIEEMIEQVIERKNNV